MAGLALINMSFAGGMIQLAIGHLVQPHGESGTSRGGSESEPVKVDPYVLLCLDRSVIRDENATMILLKWA